jgi:hypothetical protein
LPLGANTRNRRTPLFLLLKNRPTHPRYCNRALLLVPVLHVTLFWTARIGNQSSSAASIGRREPKILTQRASEEFQ